MLEHLHADKVKGQGARSSVVNGPFTGFKERRSFKPKVASSILAGRIPQEDLSELDPADPRRCEAMTLVNEKSRVPPLDPAALKRLGKALDREALVAAMLIGSQARGTAGPLSDVDIAVWHDPALDPSGRLHLQLELARAASEALGTDEVDVVMLNRAPPLLRHRAVRDGKLLVERDPGSRVRFEARSLLDYLDTKPLRVERSRGLRKRIRENRFGRP